MNDYGLGITLSLMGISITFLALGALILLIVLLRALFPSRIPEAQEKTADVDSVGQTVAMAAAWWYLRNKKPYSLGKILEQPPGRWRNPPR